MLLTGLSMLRCAGGPGTVRMPIRLCDRNVELVPKQGFEP